MRARDFIREAKKRDHHGLHNPQFSGVHVMPKLDQGYELYRLAMDMATAGGKDTKWPEKVAHPSADNSVIVAYSEGDHEIIRQALKHRGVAHKDTSKGKSKEHTETNTVSPVAKFKPTKRKK
jgi:hypothetical protein